MIEKILQIIFPKQCLDCGKIYKKWICPKCYYKLKNELKFQTIKHKKFNLYFIGFYENKIRKLLLKFKFNEMAVLANLFAEIMNKEKLFIEKIKQYDCVIPVPMYIINKKIRGYNQTELIASVIEKENKIMCINDVLVKVKQNKKQSKLNEKERIENVKDIYKLQNEEKINNKRVLLLDDIYTTGSTVKECMKILKKAKPKRIDVLVIAKRN